MATTPDARLGWLALNRFGLGARGGAWGDIRAAAADPRGFIKAELAVPRVAELESPALPATAEAMTAVHALQEQRRMDRAQQRPSAPEPPMPPPSTTPAQQAAPTRNGAPTTPRAPENPVQHIFRADALARLRRAQAAQSGFVERLVAFWSNHFCVSAAKGPALRAIAGPFEREAIRPHALGRFAAMLKAVEQHPAMLIYLDNQQSIGPNSRAGLNRRRGLNENLAREILELHTLGVDGGYTQADVGALAAIITGWTVVGQQGRLGRPGTFMFNANAHEPAAQTLLGRRYEDRGVMQGEQALDDLARQPATARHIAFKFARHFIADAPPPALVERLTKTFRDTDGDLRALAIALIDDDESWRAPATKLRTPWEYVVALSRLSARPPAQPGRALNALAQLAQPIWSPPGPNGFGDTTADWLSPRGMKTRLDIASAFARRVEDMLDADAPDPQELLNVVAGEAASPATRDAVARAESRHQAVALVLMAPEFQRR